jgi:hypothetical protein
MALRVCAKTIAGQEAYFEQNDPHPDALPSDGRGNSLIRLLHFLQRLDTPTDGGRFFLSHPMGEGRGEEDCWRLSETPLPVRASRGEGEDRFFPAAVLNSMAVGPG